MDQGADWRNTYGELKQGLEIMAKAFGVEKITEYQVKIIKITDEFKPGEVYEITATI